MKSIFIKIPCFSKGCQGFEESEFSCTFANTLCYQWFAIDFSDFDCNVNYIFAQNLCFVMLFEAFWGPPGSILGKFLFQKGFFNQ